MSYKEAAWRHGVIIMVDTIEVVNCMRELRLNTRLDLEAVHQRLPHAKLYRGRPQMLVVKMSCGRNLQLFPSGCIQILGRVSQAGAVRMSCEILHHLKQLYPHLSWPVLTLKNIVVHVQLTKRIPLHRIKHSSSAVSYEPELFPAALIRRFEPAHIAVFHTGHCIITGIKSLEQAHAIVHELMDFLNKKDLSYKRLFS